MKKFKFILFCLFFLISFYITGSKILNTSLINYLIYNEEQISSMKYNNMLKEISKSIVNDVVKETTILDNNIIINKNNFSFVNLVKKDDYKVYIYNTHDEESYSNKGFELYNTTPTVKLASYMLKDELNNLGINALVEERPVIKEIKKQGLPYHYSYDISNKYCKEIKEKYPSIIYFIDLHRDGIDKSLSTITINNKTYAKMMFLLGMKHSNSNKNLEVVTKLNNYLNDNYKGLMRNIYKRNDITYYQYFDSHNFIIEVGGQDNTYQEVYNSIKGFKMKKESIFKFILLCFIICFLVILFAGKTGYYEKKLRDNSILTEEQIKKFEEDLKNGKNVDISNYVINENKDYTTKLTSDVYSVSLKVEKTIDKIVKFIFNEVGKNIND